MNNDELAIFDDIKHSDEDIDEFWSARELYKTLGYTRWEGFLNVLEKAKISFKESEFTKDYNINDHFRQVVKMVSTGSGAERPIEDYQLSKYACYLIAQNGDPRKKPIALAQSYFNVQTLRQEQFDKMSADEKRLYIRRQVTDWDKKLFRSAQESGVENYGTFYEQDILDCMACVVKRFVKRRKLEKIKFWIALVQQSSLQIYFGLLKQMTNCKMRFRRGVGLEMKQRQTHTIMSGGLLGIR